MSSKIEKISIVLILVGLVFKSMHFPGAGVLMIVSFTSLASYYLIHNIGLKELASNSMSISIEKIMGIALAVPLIGILFRLMFWPGAQMMLLTGFILCVIGLAISLKSEKHQKNRIRFAVLSAFAALVLLTPNETLVNHYYGDNPEYARVFLRAIDNPDSLQYQEELWEYEQKHILKPDYENTDNQ